jgi:CRISPR-associated protein Cmr4
MTANAKGSFEVVQTIALAIDPIHVGTGGERLGRVDNTIVRDPVTHVPKIPGSSLAGVHRAYAAMAYEDERDKNKRKTPYYPNCAGQGQSNGKEHCGETNCEVCAVFGRASFAGLAGFSDAQVLLFPVATREGPVWITSPDALRGAGFSDAVAEGDYVYRANRTDKAINLGWLMLEARQWDNDAHIKAFTQKDVPDYVLQRLALVSDKLFSHIVNSNLEVRTSVAINPKTGAAEEGALFTYEALPRGTVLAWTITCRDPRHFDYGKAALTDINSVSTVVKKAHPFLKALGIGGMGTRGMGRLRVAELPAE